MDASVLLVVVEILVLLGDVVKTELVLLLFLEVSMDLSDLAYLVKSLLLRVDYLSPSKLRQALAGCYRSRFG